MREGVPDSDVHDEVGDLLHPRRADIQDGISPSAEGPHVAFAARKSSNSADNFCDMIADRIVPPV